MVYALMISIAVAVCALVFYKHLWDTTKEGRKELAKLNALQEKLTPALVAEAIRFNGFVPDSRENNVLFRAQGSKYLVRTNRLPYLTVIKSFNLDTSEYDMELFRAAAEKVAHNMFMLRLVVDEKESYFCFEIDAYEQSYGHFRDSLTAYLDGIEEAQRAHQNIYHKLLDDKREMERMQSKAEMVPALTKSSENKVLS